MREREGAGRCRPVRKSSDFCRAPRRAERIKIMQRIRVITLCRTAFVRWWPRDATVARGERGSQFGSTFSGLTDVRVEVATVATSTPARCHMAGPVTPAKRGTTAGDAPRPRQHSDAFKVEVVRSVTESLRDSCLTGSASRYRLPRHRQVSSRSRWACEPRRRSATSRSKCGAAPRS